MEIICRGRKLRTRELEGGKWGVGDERGGDETIEMGKRLICVIDQR